MPRPVKELSNIEIDEISLVDRPANQHAKVAIAKRATEEDNVPDEQIYDENGQALDVEQLELGDVVFDSEGNAYAVELDDESGESEEEPSEEIEAEDESELELVGKALPGV